MMRQKSFLRRGSMADIRSKSSREMKLAYIEFVEPVASVVRNRFQRQKLKEDGFKTMDPMGDDEIDILKRHLRELFSDLDLEKLQKAHTHKVQSYTDWMKEHCRERNYLFQIRKCKNENCCLPKKLEGELDWLPDPVLLDNDQEHFRSYEDSKGKDTDETDRPSYKIVEKKPTKHQRKRKHSPEPDIPEDMNVDAEDGENTESEGKQGETSQIPLTAQNARGIVNCVECRKPRLYYSKLRLSRRQEELLALAISEFDFTCGGPIADPSVSLLKSLFVREKMSCANPIETPYYSTAFAQLDLCSFCGNSDANVNQELLPMCEMCNNGGKTQIIQRRHMVETTNDI